MILEFAQRMRSAAAVEIRGCSDQYSAIIGELVHDGAAVARLADSHRDVDVFIRQVARAVIAFQRIRINYFDATGYSSRYQRSLL